MFRPLPNLSAATAALGGAGAGAGQGGLIMCGPEVSHPDLDQGAFSGPKV